MTNYDNIPNELKSLNQWVNANAYSKVPMCSHANTSASSTNVETWSSFSTSVENVKKGYYDYCGFVFADNGIVGIDIDIGYDEDGLLSDVASIIIGKCKSYTEKSKSGRGFHILVKGDIPFKGRNNLQGVEIYKSSRYFIMTGNTLLYQELVENQEAIDFILEQYFPNSTKDNNNLKDYKIYTPLWELPTNNRIKLSPNYPKITRGNRNISITSLAGQMHNIGYSKEQIYSELIKANQTACEPPLSNNEIQNICNSITRYTR